MTIVRLIHKVYAMFFSGAPNQPQCQREHPIGTIYINYDCPLQNVSAESFNSPLRAECFKHELQYTLTEPRVVIEQWHQTYSRLGFKSPQEFIRILNPLTHGNSLT